jgi:tight adherence protein C
MTALVPLLASFLVFVLIVYVGVLVMRRREASAKRRALAMVQGYASDDVHTAIARAKQEDSLVRSTLVGIGTKLISRKGLARLQRNALYAGKSAPDAVDGLIIRKLLFLVLGLVLGFLIGYAMGGLWWIAFPLLTVFGFYVPDLLIYNEGLKRDEEIAKRLPDALDMLNLCVESGLSFSAAMTQVATNQSGPVADEFNIALQEMQFGRSRGQALAAMAGRTRQEDVQRFVSAMLQVDKIGVPVATVLREQAKEMRAKRFARAREQAQKVPVKILMPLMLCFLPALFVIILGPAVYSIAQIFSGGGIGQ